MPNLILGARQINNSMAKLIADKTIKSMVKEDKKLKDANIDEKVLASNKQFAELLEDLDVIIPAGGTALITLKRGSMSLRNTGGIINLEDHEDGKMYELANFMKLYVDMNPNILELLWVDDKSIITSTNPYEHLRSNRDWMLSSKAAFTFTGYAMQQMKKTNRIKFPSDWKWL